MKAAYEVNVVGNTYKELMGNAWEEVANLFELSIDQVKESTTGEMHIRKSMETPNKKYYGSIFFSIDFSKIQIDKDKK